MIMDLWIMVFLKQKMHIAKVLLFISTHTGWYENDILNPLLKIHYHENYSQTESNSDNGKMESMLIKDIFIFLSQYPKNAKLWKHLHRTIIVLVKEVEEM